MKTAPCLFALDDATACRAETFDSHHENVPGTWLELRVSGESAGDAARAEKAAALDFHPKAAAN